MKDNTQKKSRSDQFEIESEENEKTNNLAKGQPKGNGKPEPKAPSKGKGKDAPEDSREPPSSVPAGKPEPRPPSKGSTGSAKPIKESAKTHKKKGTANDAPPLSLGMTQKGYAALQAAEAANPESPRKQIIENALMLLAGHIAYVPPIQLARLDSDTLITLAGASAKWEKSCNKIIRKIILSELDDEAKSKLVDEMKTEIQHLRNERLTMCRLAGIPISCFFIIDLEFVISELLIFQNAATENSVKAAYEKGIGLLRTYIPAEPPKSSMPESETHAPVDKKNLKSLAKNNPERNPSEI